MSTDVQASQRASLSKMLSLSGGSLQTQWKVLIYDQGGMDIIAPLFDLHSLRGLGVTSNLRLHSKRQRIPDAPAVYFISPTRENVLRISQDIDQGLYDAFYIYATSSIPEELLELLAREIASSGFASRVAKLYDQYAHFIALSPKMFTLGHVNSYSSLHSLEDSHIIASVDQTVDHLFSVFVTLGCLPTLAAPPGNAAHMVATQLFDKMRVHIKQRNHLFASRGGYGRMKRPLCIILDRDEDMMVGLHHPWTYHALISDLLGLESNSITLPRTSAKKERRFRLNNDDEFWVENSRLAFPSVAQNVDAVMKKFKDEFKSISDSPEDDAIDAMTNQLSGVIDQLPELRKKKASIEMHTDIASALMAELNERSLDSYFSLEERMLVNRDVTSTDRAGILELLDPSSPGSPQDKLRLFLIYFLVKGSKLASSDIEECENLLTAAGADLAPLRYLKVHRMVNAIASQRVDKSEKKMIASEHLFGSVTDKALNKGISWLAGNVKNLLPLSTELPITSLVKQLMNGLTHEDMVYLDPQSRERSGAPAFKGPFGDAVVFVVGGGNVTELTNLQNFAAGTRAPNERKIIYGCTDLVSPSQMVAQLASLDN